MGDSSAPTGARRPTFNTFMSGLGPYGFSSQSRQKRSEENPVGSSSFPLWPEINGNSPASLNLMKHQVIHPKSMLFLSDVVRRSSSGANAQPEPEEKRVVHAPSAQELAAPRLESLKKIHSTSTADVRDEYAIYKRSKAEVAKAKNNIANFEKIWSYLDKQGLKDLDNYLNPSIKLREELLKKEEKMRNDFANLAITSINAVISTAGEDEEMSTEEMLEYTLKYL